MTIFFIFIINFTCLVLALLVVWKVKLPVYHPISFFCIYYAIGYVLRPFVISVTGESTLWNYIGYWPTTNDVLFSSVCTNLGFLSFVFVPILFFRKYFSDVNVSAPNLVVEKKVKFLIVFAVIAVIGAYETIKTYSGIGDNDIISYTIDVDADGGQRMIGMSGYETALTEFLPGAILIWVMVYRFGWITWLIMMCFVLLRIWVGAQRSSFVIVALGCVFVYLIYKKIKWPTLKSVILVAIVGLCFDVVGSDRLAVKKVLNGDITVGQVFTNYSNSRGGRALTTDFQEFDVSTTILSVVPEKTGYNWGSQYIRLFVWPIPRQIWNDKPVFTSIINLNRIGNFFGLTWSLIADMYSNFGILSVFLGMSIVGVFMSKIYFLFVKTQSIYVYLACFTTLIYMPILFRDGPVSVVYFVAFYLLSSYLICYFGGVRFKRFVK